MGLENGDKKELATLTADMKYIRRDISEIRDTLKHLSQHYVSKDEFAPVKNIVYGLVGLVLTSFVGAVIALVLNK